MVWKKFTIVLCIAALAGVFVASRASAETPDFSGVWIPDVKDQKRQEVEITPPWKPEVLKQIQHMVAEEKAGGLSLFSAIVCRTACPAGC